MASVTIMLAKTVYLIDTRSDLSHLINPAEMLNMRCDTSDLGVMIILLKIQKVCFLLTPKRNDHEWNLVRKGEQGQL